MIIEGGKPIDRFPDAENYLTDCHVYGFAVTLMGMWVGSFTCGIPSFDLETFCAKMAEYKATWAHIVPPVAVQLANSDIAKKYDLSSLKTMIIAAAPTKKALQVRLKERFGRDCRIIQGEIWIRKSITGFVRLMF